MWYYKLSHPLIQITVVLLILVGCGAPEESPVGTTAIPPTPTPVPPTEIPPTPSPVPPTAIPPTPTAPDLNTGAEILIGNWQPLSSGRDAMYLQVNSDGTCRQSFLLDGLTGVPEVECSYTFDGTNLSMTTVELNGVPACPSPTGSYEVQLVAEDQIQLVTAEDDCGPRRRSTQGEYQRIP